MLFNSFEFIFLFLPLVLIGYFTLNNYKKEKLAKGYLVLSSLFFYGYFNYMYLILILISIIFNFFIGNKLNLESKKENRLCFFLVGLLFNILLLCYFKYYNFFITNINIIFDINIKLINIILPLGISFFTFQQLSFIIDSYKKDSVKYDFLSYCLFVTFFPQLIAGPIVLPKEMLPQFENYENKKLNYENLNKGLYLFSIGLAKKVLIADSIAVYANTGFDKMINLTFIESWITSLSYTMQLYFDFSGYCDMAMGVALMFNIILPLNFNSPYRATNIQEFWKRWHITLGRFLTTYLYIPLGGNRKGEILTLRNLLIVFFISGIWHGAGWMFIIWGMLHGISILIHRIWSKKGQKITPIIGWIITFNLVNIFWLFFRADNIRDASKILKSMTNISTLKQFITTPYVELANPYLGNKITLLILFISIFISIFIPKNSFIKTKLMKCKKRINIEIIFYLIISLNLLNKISDFLYFNF